MYAKQHQAKCSHCGRVEEVANRGTFIRHLSLPEMCAGCGEYMDAKSEQNPHWVHVIIKRRLVKPKRTANPLTWFKLPKWVEIDRHEMHAR